MGSLVLKLLAVAAALLLITPRFAWAANCGEDECGPRGACRASSLLPRCDCEEGYFSVTTFRAPSSLGAYCVPVAAPPSETACANIHCGEHGVCVARPSDAGTTTGECRCDPGYRVGNSGACEDDPGDDSEAVCAEVDCGSGIVCMATSDAVTCRCTGGGQVVLGGGADGGFGPVCSTPPDPATACGPDACGPYGSCVISQAIFCDCNEGSEPRDLIGPDGKSHPYCVKPGEPFPQLDGAAAEDAGRGDAALSAPKAGPPPPGGESGAKSGGCHLSHNLDTVSYQTLWVALALGALCARRKQQQRASLKMETRESNVDHTHG